ncbi:MAG TPA: HD domain-containing phosphohydrolase [Syntrophales bacterium]|nr:HD domain-containing phosphohydrolase [Syntrophales bacterium]
MKTKFLIVDDDEQIRSLMHDLLESHGYEVVVAKDGAEALEKARRDPPDLIVSDVLMPVMDGFTLCHKWKKDAQLKHIPLVFYSSSYTDHRDEELALKLGAERYITKPKNLTEIVKILQDVITEHKTGKRGTPHEAVVEEVGYYREYSEALIRRLEEKLSELAEANQALKQDIAERKRTEEALRESQEKYQAIFDYSGTALLFVEENLTISMCNKAFEKLSGYSRTGVEGQKKWPEIVAKGEDLKQMVDFHRLLRIDPHAAPQTYEFQLIDQEGNLKNAVITVATIPGTKQSLAALLDITDRKRAEEKLAQTMESLRKAMESTIQVIVQVVEMKDPYTAGHQKRVTSLARAIAKEMNLSDDTIDAISMAGLIHDIGKISVPVEILGKPGKLTSTEFELIKEHPQTGYDILKNIEFPWPIATIILQHHERIDGSGYPQKLEGDQILIEARILAVADVVEAIASHRPYRPALGIATALQELTKNKGKLYVPEIVDACMKLFYIRNYKLEI